MQRKIYPCRNGRKPTEPRRRVGGLAWCAYRRIGMRAARTRGAHHTTTWRAPHFRGLPVQNREPEAGSTGPCGGAYNGKGPYLTVRPFVNVCLKEANKIISLCFGRSFGFTLCSSIRSCGGFSFGLGGSFGSLLFCYFFSDLFVNLLLGV